MRTGMMALALGLLILRFLPVLPPVWLWMLLPVIGLMLLPFRSYPLAFLLFGFSWAGANAQWALDDRLPMSLDGETRWVEGRVTGLPQNNEAVVRFELADARSRHGKVPQLMRLAWYDGPPVNSGEQWRLAVKLKRPAGLLNPHAFDYDAWLLAQRIGATGTVKAGERLKEAQWAWRDGIRQRLQSVDAQGANGSADGVGAGGWRRTESRRLAGAARHRHGPSVGDFRTTHRVVGGAGVSVDRRAGPLWPVAQTLALAAVGLWTRVRGRSRLWAAGRF
jgi:Predicted membrane metal-binding protein